VSGVESFETKWHARLTEYLANQRVNYLCMDLTDSEAPYMDIGLLGARQLCRLLRGTGYGIREGRVMLDRRDRNPYTGAEFPVPAIVNPRMAAFILPALSTAEARNQHRDMLRRLGAARDTLWIAELTDRLAERNRRAIWGAMNAPDEDVAISRDSLPLASKGVSVGGEGVRGGEGRRCRLIHHQKAA
jgi:hypothetical protein